MLESPDKFERVRLEVSGHGITVTSWFDSGKQIWRANAPALLHILGTRAEDAITGTTREKAIQAIQGRLSNQLTSAYPTRR
jgi:hypothetical protein